ncbi:hypothetical protein RSAG8_02321, partial [Rhizoctonia solani AG-8 WAC10335]
MTFTAWIDGGLPNNLIWNKLRGDTIGLPPHMYACYFNVPVERLGHITSGVPPFKQSYK